MDAKKLLQEMRDLGDSDYRGWSYPTAKEVSGLDEDDLETDLPLEGQQLEAKPSRFKKLVAKLKKQKGVRDPEALAAWIGRKAGKI